MIGFKKHFILSCIVFVSSSHSLLCLFFLLEDSLKAGVTWMFIYIKSEAIESWLKALGQRGLSADALFWELSAFSLGALKFVVSSLWDYWTFLGGGVEESFDILPWVGI